MKILIPVETAHREITYKTFLAHKLVMNGYSCYIGRKVHIYNLMKNLNDFIYLDKGYHKGRSDIIYSEVKKRKGLIVSLDEEGALDFSDDSVILGRYSEELFEMADLVFFWGKKQYKLVKDRVKFDEKIEVTGHPRFELLKSKYHFIYEKEVKKLKSKYKDFILINTNMAAGNNIRGDRHVVKQYRDRIENIDKLIASNKKKVDAFVNLALDLSEKFKKTIIFRPHPEEDSSFYSKLFDGKENIHVIYEGSVIPWLLASDILIHPDCTTALESFFLGKKPLSYLPEGYSENLVAPLPLQASYCFTDKAKLISFLLDKKNYVNEKDKVSFPEEVFSFSSDTTKKIVDKIKINYPPNTPSGNNSLLKFYLFSNAKIYFMHKVYKKAVKFLTIAHKLNPENKDITYKLDWSNLQTLGMRESEDLFQKIEDNLD